MKWQLKSNFFRGIKEFPGLGIRIFIYPVSWQNFHEAIDIWSYSMTQAICINIDLPFTKAKVYPLGFQDAPMQLINN